MLLVAKPIFVILLLPAAIDLMTKNNFSNIASYIVAVVAFAAVIFLKVNPAIVMLSGLVIGFSFCKLF